MSNPDDIFEGSHAEFVANESHVSQGERDWLKFVRQCERILGHSLDGDQERDGYSLDYAYDAFAAGHTATDYTTEVLERSVGR